MKALYNPFARMPALPFDWGVRRGMCITIRRLGLFAVTGVISGTACVLAGHQYPTGRSIIYIWLLLICAFISLAVSVWMTRITFFLLLYSRTRRATRGRMGKPVVDTRGGQI